MARKFNAEKGFPFPVRLETGEKTVFDLSSDEFEQACIKAVVSRRDDFIEGYVLRMDPETGRLVKIYPGGKSSESGIIIPGLNLKF